MTIAGKDIIKKNISSFLSLHIEKTLWQECFYKIYKKEKRESLQHPEKKSACISVINEGIAYYKYLLRYLNSHCPDSDLCSYYFLIHLGDLNRYLSIEKLLDDDGTDYNKLAESFYLQAIQLDPTQGNAYNQLSVLASYILFLLSNSYRHSYCLAVYYCIRSISCDSPLQIGYDNLYNHFKNNDKELNESAMSFVPLTKKKSTQVINALYLFHSTFLYNIFIFIIFFLWIQTLSPF